MGRALSWSQRQGIAPAASKRRGRMFLTQAQFWRAQEKLSNFLFGAVPQYEKASRRKGIYLVSKLFSWREWIWTLGRRGLTFCHGDTPSGDEEPSPRENLIEQQASQGTSKNAIPQEREARFTRKGARSSPRGTLLRPVMSRGA